MWKYVSRRVKDTIELGINARKAFSLNQLSCDENQQKKQQQSDDKCYKVVLRHQDPSSRDQHRRDEKFKRRYHRLTQNQKCFLNALTWSAALVSGFYTSQLLCLYRRNHRFAVDGTRCFYSKYLLNTTQSVHQNIKYLLTPLGQRSLADSVTKFATTCPFRSASADTVHPSGVSSSILQRKAIENEIKDFQFLIDPEYKRYARFYDDSNDSDSSSKPYNLSNDKTSSEYKVKSDDVKSQPENLQKSSPKSQDEAIDEAVKQLADIVGELEFQLGVESYRAAHYEDAAEHFKLSTNYQHLGGIFNLAICYEQGLGVKKNLKTAKQLYEIASGLGHVKAMYNLGVFHAQGLGTSRDFHRAKKYFSEAAKLGNRDASEAIKLLLPKPIILPVIEEYDELFFNNTSSKLGGIDNHKMMRIAVT